jgi:hypothetical protein
VPYRKLNLPIGELPPPFDDWRETALWCPIDDFAGSGASHVQGHRECLWLLFAGDTVCQIIGAKEHVGTPKLMVNADLS